MSNILNLPRTINRIFELPKCGVNDTGFALLLTPLGIAQKSRAIIDTVALAMGQ